MMIRTLIHFQFFTLPPPLNQIGKLPGQGVHGQCWIFRRVTEPRARDPRGPTLNHDSIKQIENLRGIRFFSLPFCLNFIYSWEHENLKKRASGNFGRLVEFPNFRPNHLPFLPKDVYYYNYDKPIPL